MPVEKVNKQMVLLYAATHARFTSNDVSNELNVHKKLASTTLLWLFRDHELDRRPIKHHFGSPRYEYFLPIIKDINEAFEEKVLTYATKHGSFNSKDISTEFNISQRRASLILQKMARNHEINKRPTNNGLVFGSPRYEYYVPKKPLDR